MSQPRLTLTRSETLSKAYYTLTRVSFDWQRTDGRVQSMSREVFDRGHGAAILPCDTARRTVLLIRQFRYPALAGEGGDGMLIEAAAGELDNAGPATRIKAEAEEELGLCLDQVEEVFSAFTSPGAVTEKLTLFIARYTIDTPRGAGGGREDEGEDIEVIELDFDTAYAMIASGEIRDAKTIMLLQHAKIAVF